MGRWDASIDLTSAVLQDEPGPLPIERVRAAVEALEGAAFVSVEDCRGAPANLRWLTLYEPGDARPRSGGPWDALAIRVEATVRAALVG